MALVGRLTQRSQARNGAHEAVEATYCTFHDGGRRYLQICTYGRPGREHAGTVSQTIQLDEAGAAALLAIIRREFRLP